MYRGKRRGKAKGLKKKVAAISKVVAKLKPEMKESIVTSWNITGNYQGSNTALNGSYTYANVVYNPAISLVAQGADYNQRVGREIKPYMIEIEAVLNGSSTPGLDAPYRLIVYQDRGYDGATLPSLNMLLVNPSTATGEFNNYFASYNPDYVAHKGDRKNRYKILIDKKGFVSPRIAQTSSAAAAYNNNNKTSTCICVKKWFKNPEIINYSGTANNTHVGGSIFFVLFLGNSSTAVDNTSCHMRTRLLYTDT